MIAQMPGWADYVAGGKGFGLRRSYGAWQGEMRFRGYSSWIIFKYQFKKMLELFAEYG